MKALRAELTELMIFVATVHKNYNSLSFSVWPEVLRMKHVLVQETQTPGPSGHSELENSDCDSLKNIFALLKIAMCFPISTAEAERGFSLMQRVKDDYRSRMKSTTLADFMLIRLHGSSIIDFDPEPAIKLWYSSGKRKRRQTPAYGSRLPQTEDTEKDCDGPTATSDHDEDCISESD